MNSKTFFSEPVHHEPSPTWLSNLPVVKTPYLNNKLKQYLLFQHFKHTPSPAAWGSYGKIFEHNSACGHGSAHDSTLANWPYYQRLCKALSAKYLDQHPGRIYDYFIIDSLSHLREKIELLEPALNEIEFLEPLHWLDKNNNPIAVTHLQLVRIPRAAGSSSIPTASRLDRLSCFPCPFRLLPFIFGFLEGKTEADVSQADLHDNRLEIEDTIQSIRAHKRKHSLFVMVADVLANMPAEVFTPTTQEGQFYYGLLCHSVENLLSQALLTTRDFDALCLHHEMIHHALFMLCVLAKPHSYNDFLRIGEQLNQSYFLDQESKLTIGQFLFPSASAAMMECVLSLQKQQALKISFVDLTPDACAQTHTDHHELKETLKPFVNHEPPNVIITGIHTRTALQSTNTKTLMSAIQQGLATHPSLTVIFHLPFNNPEIITQIWKLIQPMIQSGRLNLIIAEGYLGYKGFGVGKCLGSRLLSINNGNKAFRELNLQLENQQRTIFDSHPAFQYILSILEQGYCHELFFINQVMKNQEDIYNIDRGYAQQFNKPALFEKTSTLLFTQVEERYFLQTDINEQTTLGFTFTSYKRIKSPDGAYQGIELSLGLEPLPLLFAKLKPVFDAYYENTFTSTQPENARQISQNNLPLKNPYLLGQIPPTWEKQSPKNNRPLLSPSEKPSKRHASAVSKTQPNTRSTVKHASNGGQTSDTGKDAPLEKSILHFKSCFTKQGIELKPGPIHSPLPGVHLASISLAACPFFEAQGKGTTSKAAQASALGELMELTSNNIYWNFRYLGQETLRKPFTYFPQEKWQRFKNNNWQQEVLDPHLRKRYKKINCLTPEALTDINSPADNPSLCAMPFVRISDQAAVYFPNNIIQDLYHCNGLAAGNTQSEARVHALGEIFERYVKTSVHRQNLCLPDIPEAAYKDFTVVNNIIYEFKKLGFQVWVKDGSFNGNFPVVNVTIQHKDNHGCYTSFGSAPDLSTAIERCLTEIIQDKSLDSLTQLPKASSDLALTKSFENLEQYFEPGGSGKLHVKFFNHTPDYNYAAWPVLRGNNDALFSQYCDILSKLGLDIYIADYKHLGIDCCRIIVPQFSEHYFFNPLTKQHYHATLLPARELLLHLPELSTSESQEVLHFLQTCGFPLNETMNEILGLHANGNGFWDWAKVKDTLFLLEQKVEKNITPSTDLKQPFAPEIIEKVMKKNKELPEFAYSVQAYDFSLTQQFKIMRAHNQITHAKYVAYNPQLKII